MGSHPWHSLDGSHPVNDGSRQRARLARCDIDFFKIGVLLPSSPVPSSSVHPTTSASVHYSA